MASLILILAVVGLVAAATVAGLSHLARSRMLEMLGRMPLEERVTLLLVWSLSPLLAALLAVLAVLTPSILAAAGVMADHCLIHGTHHSHLCLLHPGTTPTIPGAGLLLGLIAAGLVLVGAYKGRQRIRAGWQWRSLRRLAQSESAPGIRVLGTDRPVAATVGLLWPAVFLSTGLLYALDPHQRKAVVSHEAAHRRRRDPLRLALARLGVALHVPHTGRALYRAFELTVERTADEAAARTVGERVTVAEALLAVARMRPVPAPGPAFTDDPLEVRVQALLEDAPDSRPPWWGLGAVLAGLALGLLALSPQFHHGLETLLGHI